MSNMKDLTAREFGYGHPTPLFMIGTYDEVGRVNFLNSQWGALNHGGYINLNINTNKKTHRNIEEMKAFTVTRATEDLMPYADFFGTYSGYQVPDKFEKTGLTVQKAKHVNAPIIDGSTLVIECELADVLYEQHIHTVIGRIVNVSVDESVLDASGQVDAGKLGMIFFDSFSRGYFTLGNRVGDAWSEGRVLSAHGGRLK